MVYDSNFFNLWVFKMYETNDYGDTVLPVVDCFGNLVAKLVLWDDGTTHRLVPILAMDGFNRAEEGYYYWVTK